MSHAKIPGCVLTMGEGDTGQLGLGPDVMERVKPAKVDLPKDNVVQVYAGGMHTVCLTAAGEVSTLVLVATVGNLAYMRPLLLQLYCSFLSHFIYAKTLLQSYHVI